MREKIAECVANIFLGEMTITDFENVADKVLSLPSGLIAGEHVLTVQEVLEDYQRIILDCPAYPCVGYFNGHRITKPIPPSEDK